MGYADKRGVEGHPPSRPLRILWVSDALWHQTGYGTQTREICKRMVQDGHTVWNYAPGAFHGGSAVVDGVTILSSEYGDDRWGNATLPYHIQQKKPDVVITWLDPQGLAAYGLDTTPLYIWAPIDTWPIPQQEQGLLSRAKRIMACSQWGQKVLKVAGFDSDYIPCGIDLSKFYIDLEGGKRFRKSFDIREEAFLIGMAGLNTGMPDRKAYGAAFEVIRDFAKAHENVQAFIHTNPEGDGQSINLLVLRQQLGLENVISFPPPVGSLGWPEDYMKDMYNAFDVFLHTSGCEGFGLPVLEAQACGTPVVANFATAHGELVNHETGYPAEPAADMYVTTATKIAIASPANLLAQMEEAYESLRRSEFTPHYRRGIALNYDWDIVWPKYWRPLLANIPETEVFEKGRKLMIGAGQHNREGFTHHDRELYYPHTNVAHDLTEFPWPWEDDSWDYIEMTEVMEHLRPEMTDVMNELWRITAPGGHVFISVPEAGSWKAAMDPTHVRGFMFHSFDYYDPDTGWGKMFNYTKRKWRLVKRSLQDGGLAVWMTPRK